MKFEFFGFVKRTFLWILVHLGIIEVIRFFGGSSEINQTTSIIILTLTSSLIREIVDILVINHALKGLNKEYFSQENFKDKTKK